MNPYLTRQSAARFAAGVLLAGAALQAQADAVIDWNIKSGELILAAKLGTPPAIRTMAIVQTAVHDGVAATAGDTAAIDAAVAAVHRVALGRLIPAQQAAIDAAYQAAMAKIPESPARQQGIAAGEKAAASVLAERANDGAATPESYRPHTTPGMYVPTATPAVPTWSQRKPWLMTSPSQFRPGPPPALSSELWARDYRETAELGGKASTQRTPAQSEIAKFWEFSLPSIYDGVVRSVAGAPGRSPLQNARLFAAVAQAMDDAMIAVFDAKYHYNLWRPATAIRNGDLDGNEATARDAGWSPLIDNPMHPEYPSGHSILAGTVATILRAEVGPKFTPLLATSSPSAKGATRQWTDVDAFVQEVSAARIYGGLHYRFSTRVAEAMGQQIGSLAVARHLTPPQ